MEFTDQELFERCGTKLNEVKLKQILEICKNNTRDPIIGTPKVGAVVDGYEILGYLGSGSSGTACLAFKNGFYFVLKFMGVKDSQRGPTEEFTILRAQLESENYQHCLTAFEWKQWTEWKDLDYGDLKQELRARKEKLRYMVIKLAGPSLTGIIPPDSLSFSINQGISLMKKSLLALQLLHKDNYIHRDLKLGNMALDIHDEERVVLIDYGFARKAPHFKTETANTYRDDCKAWFKSFFTFEPGLAARHGSISNSLDDEPTFWSRPNAHAEQILKHINHLGFYQTMNFDFVHTCLQNMYDEANGIRVIPYVYKKVGKAMKIVHGNYEFAVHSQGRKDSKRYICRSCDFSIFVDIDEFKEAEDGSIATIIDTFNHHHKCTQN